ncbi:MAG: hypothetical protein HY216_11565 [Candidatus Rokubacteria bacterium]|nr:hypothetical protein [Candidatus Rokubacteria bacterium]
MRRLMDRARRDGFTRVLVDTSGLVAGRLGRVVADGVIDAAGADLVVALQHREEIEHILRHWEEPRGAASADSLPRLLRLPALTGHRPRTARMRREHREQALAAWLRDARIVRVDLSRVTLGASGRPVAELRGALAGLHDAAGETLGVGVIREVDEAAGTLRVETTVPAERVARVEVERDRRA